MSLWRLHTNTETPDGKKIADYCKANKCLAIGWSLNHFEENTKEANERDNIESFEQYAEIVKKYKIYDNGKVNDNVNRFAKEIEKDDLVWIRDNGIYYLGRVTEKSKWLFNKDKEALALDATNQYSNIEWHTVGDESSVPGGIITAFIRGSTFQRIHKDYALEFSQLKYNELAKYKHYKDVLKNKNITEKDFYSLISPEACEDLLCLWLYFKEGYICIPSTNKVGTEAYECILVDPKTGKKIYPQVKNGEVSLKDKDYAKLTEKEGEVWLLSTKGKVEISQKYSKKIFAADPKELYEFVKNEEARKFLPDSIISWYDFLNQK